MPHLFCVLRFFLILGLLLICSVDAKRELKKTPEQRGFDAHIYPR